MRFTSIELDKIVVCILILGRNFVRGKEDMARSFLKADTLKIHLFAVKVETYKASARVCGWVIVIELLEAPNL